MTQLLKSVALTLALMLSPYALAQSTALSNSAKLNGIRIVTDPAYAGGAKCDGTTNDTAALQAAFNAITTGSTLLFPPNATCMHAGYISITDKTGFSIIGSNTTLKTINSTAVTAGNGGIKITGSSYGYVAGLIIDENRANRSPSGAADSMGVHIGQDSSFITFERVYVRNAVSDGWYIYKSTGAAPTDISIIDGEGSNSFRNNMSIVGATRVKVLRGRYYSATGTAPQTGIDVEPDTGMTNTDIELIGVRVDSNVGYGVQIGGAGANTRISLTDVVGTANTLGLLNASGGNDIKVRNLAGYTYSSNPTRSIVDFGSSVVGLDVDGVWLKDLTFSSTTLGAVYTHASITGPVVLRNINVNNFAGRGLDINTPDAILTGVALKSGTNGSNYGLVITGARVKATDVSMHTMTGGAVFISSAQVTLQSAKLHDVSLGGQVIKVDTGGDYFTLNDIEVTSSGAKANTNALNVTAGVLCKQINGFAAKDSASGWTSANIFSVNRATIAGSKIDNVSPDPLQTTATWDIPNMVAGAFQATSITFTLATMGDYVEVSSDQLLDDGVVTGYVVLRADVPADGFVRVAAFNPGSAAFNPASATIAVKLRKR